MRIYISGGCKNGKSTHAQSLAVRQKGANNCPYYVATMNPRDLEDEERIKRHQADREGLGFETVELFQDIEKLEGIIPVRDSSLLLDSVTALLSNEMFKDGQIHPEAPSKITEELKRVINHFKNIVLVSDYLYADEGVYDAYSEEYRRGLARIDTACARQCDIVLEVCAGYITVHKGKAAYETIMEGI